MYNDDLVNLYIGYLKDGMTYEDLYSMLEYDYNLFLKKVNGEVSIDTKTNIYSFMDAKIKYQSLKRAKEILEFPGYQFRFLLTIDKNLNAENY